MSSATRNATPGAQNSLTITTPADTEILLTRVFDAPRELVFKAMTDPTMIPRWWGPARYTTTVDKLDLRPGGAWRFVQRAEDGGEHGFRGEFREVVPPERLAYTFEWEGLPGHISLESITLEEQDGKTTVYNRVSFQSQEDRDGMLQSGMESGASESMDRLEALLAAA